MLQHQSIFEDLCIELHNCADCWDEETHQADCRPSALIHPYEVSEKGFCMEGGYSERLNQKLAKVAHQHGYACSVISNSDGCQMRFSK